MVTHPRKPVFVKAAQILFFANAAIWLAFGVVTLARMAPGGPPQQTGTAVLAGLMLGNAVAMLVAGIGIGRQSRLFFFFAILVLVANILLSATDQFGVYDFVTLVIDGFLLGLLLATRSQYLETS
jgi:hypothetical protein